MISSIAALILSLATPGSGQVFNGQYGKAAVFGCIFVFGRYVFLPLLLRIIAFKNDVNSLRLIYIFNIIYPVVIILSAVDAAYSAPHLTHTYHDLLYAFFAAISLGAAYKGLANKFIIYAMCGREDMAEYILVKRQNAAPRPPADYK
ncbi:MAG: hypothetical protein LBL61_04550 [Elusimicrobiota bacterium]|jgi:hypothetical protein|nr:hypothetical protein [Elusimicrobiota bacterium]